jgi:activator of 2-hydroxyglutaryl-CoA dehydratase
MAFTGKATYHKEDRQSVLDTMRRNRVIECLADLIKIVSPYETPLLDALGDPLREANSTNHEWMDGEIRDNNHTQEFKAKVEALLESENPLSLADEMDYQKQERLRELIRELENTVINGIDSDLVHMKGIITSIKTNIIEVEEFNQSVINKALKQIWENSNGNIDLIVCSGYQKRKLGLLCSSTFESDLFGVSKVVLSRWVPKNIILLLDSSRINVVPLVNRSFYFKTIASDDGYRCGEIIGEYTLEFKNEKCHGIVKEI